MQTATVLYPSIIMSLFHTLVATICKPARQGMVRLVVCSLVLLGILASSSVLASGIASLEHLEHRRWLAADGGPSQVGAIAQTRNGYLWLGTNDSLYRFDGSRFVRYEAPDGKALGIVSSLLADGDDLWVGLRAGGVVLVNAQGMQRFASGGMLPGGAVYSLARDRKGFIWAAADDGLARFDGKRWQHVSAELKFPGRKARTVFVGRNGTVWAVNEYRLFYLPEGASAFIDSGLAMEGVSNIAQAMDDSIWVTERYSGRLHRIVSAAGKLFISRAGSATSSGLLFDRNGALWISTLGRGLKYVAEPTDIYAIGARERFSSKDGLSSDYVWPMLEDRDGNVWVGTNAGLDRFRPRTLMPSDFPVDALNYALVAGADGNIWAGSSNRPAMRVKDGNLYPLSMPAPVTSAIRDSTGRIWMAGPGGIWRSEGARLVFAAFLPQDAPADSSVRAMVHDADGNLWVSINRLGLFKLHAGVWSRVPTPTTVASQLMPVVAAAGAGRLWFGYRDNLLVMRDAQGEKQWSQADGLNIGHITAIAPQAERTWIGGQHGLGFVRDQRFHALQMPGNGLFDNIYAILIVPRKEGEDVWIHTKAGIFELASGELEHAVKDPAYQIRYRSYNLMGGLANDPYQVLPLPTAIRADDGLLWFSTSNGVMWIDPKRPRQDDAVPEVTIESVSVDGAYLAHMTPAVLAAHAQRIVIDYAALSLSAPESLSYRYRLDGYDQNWHDAGRQSEVTYTALAAGNYRFRVLAYNKDGLPSSHEAEFAFTIPQVFYKQPLFLLGIGAAIFVLLWIFYRINARRAAEHMRSRLEERHAERERIARELHDTLLQSVYGLILRFQAVAQSIPADHPARIGLEKALDRADEVLIEGRDRVRDLRSDEVATGDLHDCIRALGVSLAYDGGTSFHLSVIGTPLPLKGTVRDEIYRIAHEAMSNAFRHAHAQQVNVGIEYSLRSFQVKISDDGVGIDHAYISNKGRPDHWGLRGMHERARKIGADLTINSIRDGGTEIVLSMSAGSAYRNLMRCWLNRIGIRKKTGSEM